MRRFNCISTRSQFCIAVLMVIVVSAVGCNMYRMIELSNMYSIYTWVAVFEEEHTIENHYGVVLPASLSDAEIY